MKSVILTTAAVAAAMAAVGQHPANYYEVTPGGLLCEDVVEEPWSMAMVRSEMERYPESWMIDFSKAPKWSYVMGLEIGAILEFGKRYNNYTEIIDYALDYADIIVQPDGSITTYRSSDYNIDQLNSGKYLMDVYELTGEEKYRLALDMLFNQMKKHPRTSEGGFWHKQIYPHQMWLDGLYMGSPFLARYASEFLDDPTPVYDDVVMQFELAARHTYDPATGLWKHAWDESREQFWADPDTGQSKHTWGRALGWYMMALTDVLDYLPEDYAGRESISDILRQVADAVIRYRDPESGVWYQVMDQPGREGNYLEATCSSMFSYSLLKAARRGYLPESYWQAGKEAFNSTVMNFISVDLNGVISLEQCCAVAGLGGSDRRDGTFDYYVNERIIANDPKGVGPFILAAMYSEGRL
ncbi:MAG: glycoside hydrolase family 88 protein [Rikenellaceae bacterium]|nr:glycoside hydrolase family 88 protein [Rikenellaceae bacterium]